MKVHLYYIGKPKDRHMNELAADFVARASHYCEVRMAEIRPEKLDQREKHPVFHPRAQRIFLDPGGRAMDSEAFAALFAKAEMTGRDMVFVVGGADGLPAGWRETADLVLSLSPMTFPHELARAMLAEQIYRAFAILRGHPYPR